jgi:hypothetical protein
MLGAAGALKLREWYPAALAESSQSEEGSGLASLIFICWSQHSSDPLPGLLQSTSVPHFSQL